MNNPAGVEGVDYDNSILTERRVYRRALDEIIKVSDDPEAVRIAHQAITPYTNWRPATAEETAELERAIRTPESCNNAKR